MQNVLVSVRYDTARSSKDPASYSVSYIATNRQVTEVLRQKGEVFNDLVTYEGIFASEAEATRAVLGYLNCFCSIMEVSDVLSGTKRIAIAALADKLPPTGQRFRLLGRRTRHGTFIAERRD